jgi:outer membrane protein TolC
LFENGFQEEESVEQLRLTLAEINTQLRYAQNLETITLNMLKLLLGIPIENALSLLDSLESLIDDGLFESFTNQSKSIANNIDVKIAENNLASESLLYRYEQSKALPKLSAFINGNYSGFGNQFNFLKSDQKWFGSSLIGVSLNVPIFSSFGKSAMRQKAKIAVEQAQTDLEETQSRVQVEIASAKNDYQLAVETYFTSKENLTLAVNIEKKNQTKYFEGIATSFELREAQLQLYGAQRNYLQSIQNIIAKKAALLAILNLPQE